MRRTHHLLFFGSGLLIAFLVGGMILFFYALGQRMLVQDTTGGDAIISQPAQAPHDAVAKGRILYVQQGDLWALDLKSEKSFRLIDDGTIERVLPASDGSAIIFSKIVSVKPQDVLPGSAAEKSDLTRADLYIANRLGQNPIKVHEGVAEWGWIPESNFLWFETTSLQRLFEWGYYGNGDRWVARADGKEAQEVLSPRGVFGILGWQWSPDGKRALYVDASQEAEPLVLKVFNRETSEDRELFPFPYLGERGGPPPIPPFFWSRDSKRIYTALTALGIFEAERAFGLDKHFQENQFSIWEIDAEAGSARQLLAEGPASESHDATIPLAVFSPDFSYSIFPRFTPPEAWPDYETALIDLMRYDMKTGRTSPFVQKLVGRDFAFVNAQFPDATNPLVAENNLFLFTLDRQRSEAEISSFDLRSGKKITQATLSLPGHDFPLVIPYLHYDEASGTLYFSLNEGTYTNFSLYRLQRGNVEKILVDISSAVFVSQSL